MLVRAHSRSACARTNLNPFMVHNHSHWGIPPLLIFFCISISITMASAPASESDLLLKFKASLANTAALDSWNASTSPCSGWVGLKCIEGIVRGLQLESMGLMGDIDADTLAGLKSLRFISLVNNSFNCPMPQIWKLGALKSVYLSNNHFSGEIPDDGFANMGSLKFLHLANNEFTGKIPSSLARLHRLLVLTLDGNKFEGNIPDFQQKNLRKLNLANNQLVGPIPASLSKMEAKSFEGQYHPQHHLLIYVLFKIRADFSTKWL